MLKHKVIIKITKSFIGNQCCLSRKNQGENLSIPLSHETICFFILFFGVFLMKYQCLFEFHNLTITLGAYSQDGFLGACFIETELYSIYFTCNSFYSQDNHREICHWVISSMLTVAAVFKI